MRFFQLLLFFFSVSYPFIVWYAFVNSDEVVINLLATMLFLLGFLHISFSFATSKITSANASLSRVGAGLLMIVTGVSFVFFHSQEVFRIYPIMMSLLFFALFFSSLFTQETIIERFAKKVEKNIDTKKRQYMYKLTQIWCVFFLINASISFYTWRYLDITAWTLYNGVISYLLIGSLLVAERIFRYLFIQKRPS